MPPPRQLPEPAASLCAALGAPPRLVAHLRLVHDVAHQLLDSILARYPALPVEHEAVYFGAATHDLGKVLHPQELTGPGDAHEGAGEELLRRHGVPSALARFARTHSAVDHADLPLEDLLVALADSAWKGKRRDDLESSIAERIAGLSGTGTWEVWSSLDAIIERVSVDADARLEWQLRHEV